MNEKEDATEHAQGYRVGFKVGYEAGFEAGKKAGYEEALRARVEWEISSQHISVGEWKNEKT